MYKINKLDLISVARILTFISVACWIVFSVIYTVIIFLTESYMARHFFDMDLDYYGVIAILVGLAVSAIIGFVSGIVVAVVYNLIASWIGGIKLDIELEPDEEAETTQTPAKNKKQP